MKTLTGKILNIRQKTITEGDLTIENNIITGITEHPVDTTAPYIMPGFIDAHVHIESTLLTPLHYAQMAVTQGSVAAVCDPHEIANVLGVKGIEYMLSSADKTRFKFSFGVPSCVPSTPFETAGATLDANDVEQLMATGRFYGLAEMMNFPGVLNNDTETLAKIDSALKRGLKVDGHAPGLDDEASAQYVAAGISSDHEMYDIHAARKRIALGQKIQIREGSAACNLDTLMPLLGDTESMGQLMFCTDDKYPDELRQGYINQIAARCIACGYDLWAVLHAACITPVDHYKLNVGTLQVGESADFIVVDNLRDFHVRQTFIDGICLFGGEESVVKNNEPESKINDFTERSVTVDELKVEATEGDIKVIEATEGSLYTHCGAYRAKIVDGNVVPDVENDVLKIAVVNRYKKAKAAIGFIHGFGMKRGAIASTIAHDSHNIIALGCTDSEIATAINHLEHLHGGLCVVDGSEITELPLPIAGLMSDRPCDEVAAAHLRLKAKAKALGCPFNAPYMTLAFMALPVIPELKLTDMGLFDGIKFQFTTLQ